MSSTTLSKELMDVLRALKLGQLAPTLPDRMRQATDRALPLEDALLLLLGDEVQRRANVRVENRSQKAGIKPSQVFESWDTSAKVTYDKTLLSELQTLRFMDQRAHVLICGPVGVGKTMLGQAFARRAIERGHSALFLSAEELFRCLRGARLDDSHRAELRRLLRVDLLVVDDFALRAMTTEETMDMHEIVSSRHRRASMIVTSNRTPEEWLPQLADRLHAQALVDRFHNNAFDLVIEGESYRKQQKPRLSRR
jgi:DNA replication protein DnaC